MKRKPYKRTGLPLKKRRGFCHVSKEERDKHQMLGHAIIDRNYNMDLMTSYLLPRVPQSDTCLKPSRMNAYLYSRNTNLMRGARVSSSPLPPQHCGGVDGSSLCALSQRGLRLESSISLVVYPNRLVIGVAVLQIRKKKYM